MAFPNLFSLHGKVALITGANGGLGLAMARGYREAGATVCVTGRDEAKNAAVAAELGDSVFPLDVRDEDGVARTIDDIVRRHGRIDVVVNNAGLQRGGPLADLAVEAWNDVIGTHMTGPFLVSKCASRAMISAARGGKIINIASIYADFGPPDFADYAAAKAGLLGLTRALAVELAAHDIQVNAILPGYFETEMSEGVPAWLKESLISKTPAGRWGRPDELVGAAIFLASSASSYITGSCLTVDGGYSIQDRIRYW